MDGSSDTYRTLSKPSKQILLKEKKSKFYGYAFPIQNEGEVKSIIETLRKKHHTAGHVCYAWQMGTEKKRYRVNDDGEPNNSAGQPIYGQIQAFEVTNVLIAVARIFGGTKLGVGGLISTYRTAAQMTLEASEIVERVLDNQFMLSFSYQNMDKVMRIVKQKQCKIILQKMDINCELIVSIRKSQVEKVLENFNELHELEVKQVS